MKRLIPLALCLAVLLCSVAPLAYATEVEADGGIETYATYETPALDMYNFSVTRLLSESAGGYISFLTDNISAFTGILYNAYFTNSCVITSAYGNYLFGYYWDDVGKLRVGRWTNSLSSPNASQFGVFPLGTYELYSSGYAWYTTSSGPLYFSKALAEQQEDFLTATVFACAWDRVPNVSMAISAYQKKSSDTVWQDETVFFTIVSNSAINGDLVSSTNDKFVAYPADADAITWNGVPSGGTTSGSGGSGDGDTTNAPYIYVSTPTTVTKGLYIIPRAELMNPGDISGNILCFLSGHNSAYTKLTESDSLDNMWTLDCGRDETASSLTLTFMVDGRPDIYTTCVVSVLDSETDNEGISGDLPGSGTATEPPDPTYSGGEDADDFNNSVGDQKDEFDDAMDVLDDMTYPDYGEVDPGFSEILDDGAIELVAEALSKLFQNEYILQVFFIVFTLGLVSFVVFGKR